MEKIQFERAELADGAPAPSACGICAQPLAGSYYQIGSQAACERCKAQVQFDQMASGSGVGRFVRAGAFGFGAALLGGALWYAVRAATGYEVGLIAIVVGLMVGGAVRAGSRRRGGLLYQSLAVALTYFGICAQYAPDVWKALRESAEQEQTGAASDAVAPATPAPAPAPAGATAKGGGDAEMPTLLQVGVALAVVLGIALAAPFLGGLENLIGLLIIGFALWEAWKLNRHVPLEISGPFRVAAPVPPAPSG